MIAYAEHPVTPEEKAEYNKKGYKIIDAKFAPEKLEKDDKLFLKETDKEKDQKPAKA